MVDLGHGGGGGVVVLPTHLEVKHIDNVVSFNTVQTRVSHDF